MAQSRTIQPNREGTNPIAEMETANGTLHIGDLVRVGGFGPDRGKVGRITHLYGRGVYVGLVVIDERTAVEGVNALPVGEA